MSTESQPTSDFQPSGNWLLDQAAQPFVELGEKFKEMFPEPDPEAPTDWVAHTDEDGEVYHTLEGVNDRRGRPVRYRERTAHSNRAQRRAAGIRTPVAVLEAWQEAMNESWKQLLNEEVTDDGSEEGGEARAELVSE